MNPPDEIPWIAYLHIAVDFLHRQAHTDMGDLPEVVYNGLLKAQKTRVGLSRKKAFAYLLNTILAEHPQKAEMLTLFAKLK